MTHASQPPLAVVTGASSGTNLFERADMLDTKVGAGAKDDPAKVAEQGFEALMRGEDHVVAGSRKNKAQAVEQHRRMAEPGSAS
jgi:hypothetical protein